MKKIIEKVKNNAKVIVAFIIGAVIFGGTTAVIATSIASSAVTYTKTNGTNTTVDAALNELYSVASNISNIKVVQGANNWYGIYVCDGSSGRIKACSYGNPKTGSWCDGGIGHVGSTYACTLNKNNGSSIQTICLYNGSDTSIYGGGLSSMTTCP